MIGHQWPEPKSSAAGTRMMQLLELFQKMGFQINYLKHLITTFK
jgi:hypothetical protein